MLIDLHTHTKPRSWDSFITPDEMVDLAKEAGLDAMVLAEHDWAWEADEVADLAKQHDFTIIRAMEITPRTAISSSSVSTSTSSACTAATSSPSSSTRSAA